jgi:hypothetical protein
LQNQEKFRTFAENVQVPFQQAITKVIAVGETKEEFERAVNLTSEKCRHVAFQLRFTYKKENEKKILS